MPRRASAPKPASLAAALQNPTSTLVDRPESSKRVPDVPVVPTTPDDGAPQVDDDAIVGAVTTTAAPALADDMGEAAPLPVVTPAADPTPPVETREAPAEADEPHHHTMEQAPAPVAETSVRSAATTAARTPAPESASPSGVPDDRALVLDVDGLTKSFDGTFAVDHVSIAVRAGSIFGIVGPNGAGKTTTLSMVTGLLRPDAGRVLVHGADVWKDPVAAKRNMGVLPDRLRLFDRLTGAQLLYYSGTLRGLDRKTVKSRSADLAVAFGLEEALGRLVTDYSAGMTKKIALAAAMIHSPRLLILDEPFEAVDPVSAANVIEILQKYTAAGGTVVMSSHSMDLIQRICDSVSIIVRGSVLATGSMDEVRRGATLEDRFVELAGGRKAAEGMEWLHSFSA